MTSKKDLVRFCLLVTFGLLAFIQTTSANTGNRKSETSELLPQNSQEPVLVVASNAEHHVALINPSNFALITTLPTGKGPHEITISPDGRLAYVAIPGTGPNGIVGNSITVIDLEKRIVKTTFHLGKYTQPHDTAISEDGRLLWVTCAPSRTIVELDTDSGKILKTYNIPQDGAWFLKVTPDGRKIYTSNLEGKSVCVIDRATASTQTIALEAAALGIDVTPDGKELWVCSSALQVIDTATDKIIATMPVGGSGASRLKLTADGKRVLVSISGAKQLALFDVKTRRRLATIELTKDPKVITISGDGKQAFLSNPEDNTVTVVDLIVHKQVATIAVAKKPDGVAWAKAPSPVPFNNEHPAWSPDGKRIVFASNRDGNNEIYVMNADGANQQRLTQAPGRDAHPAWSPDGKKIAFQSPREGDGRDTNLYVMNADGSNQTKITNNHGFCGVPAWSPDGKRIVFQWRFAGGGGERWHIFVINADGTGQTQLTNDAANNQVPNWSPDGKTIIFYSDVTGKNQLYLMNPDGSNKRRLTNNAWNDHAAFWSRDGKRIMFISDRDGTRDIYVMHADGSNQTRISQNLQAYQANWSADGDKIVFGFAKDHNTEIYVMNRDGSNRIQLTNGQAKN
jgi:Tol biopolymer transport system component